MFKLCSSSVFYSTRGCLFVKECKLQWTFCSSNKWFSMSSGVIKLPPYFDLDVSEFKEPKEPIDVPVTGVLPKWLSGSLYRNGSGIYRLNDTTWKHAFDGLAVLHRWTILDGKVTYLSAALDSDHYKKCVKYDRLVGGNFGTTFPDPCQSIFKRFFSYFIPMPPEKSDNTAVSFMQHGDRLLALTESSVVNEINPQTLQRSNKVHLQESLVVHTGTAHPHSDKDGSCIFYGTHYGPSLMHKFIRIPLPQRGEPLLKDATIVASIPTRWRGKLGYTHSFGITENYIVHFEQPFLIDGLKILTTRMRDNGVAGAMASAKEEPINIVVVCKKTGKKLPVTFLAPHGFVFHFINCYEEGGNIICDVCLFKDATIVEELYLESLCNEKYNIRSNSSFARFVLPIDVSKETTGANLVKLDNSKATAILTDKVTPEPVLQVSCDYIFDEQYDFELPRINYDYNAARYRYAYGTSAFNKIHRRLMKFDVLEKKVLEWTCDENHFPGEPVFVSGPDKKAEDDGVILCPIVATSTEHSSFLLVLDAATMTEIARATIPVEMKMNYSFHGLFINDPAIALK